jgi:hypothetical protein
VAGVPEGEGARRVHYIITQFTPRATLCRTHGSRLLFFRQPLSWTHVCVAGRDTAPVEPRGTGRGAQAAESWRR